MQSFKILALKLLLCISNRQYTPNLVDLLKIGQNLLGHTFWIVIQQIFTLQQFVKVIEFQTGSKNCDESTLDQNQ